MQFVWWEEGFKILAVFALSFVFGFNRQRAHKPIGFGTFTLVSIGACSLGILSNNIDPEKAIPLLGATITSIGFLGGGALVKTTDKIFGFTSASSIWIFAIFGLLVGYASTFADYILPAIIYLMVVLIVMVDKHLEKRGIGSYQKRMSITTNRIVNEKDIESVISIGSVKLKKISVDVHKNDNKMTLLYLIEGKREDINQIPQKLYEKIWFASFHVE